MVNPRKISKTTLEFILHNWLLETLHYIDPANKSACLHVELLVCLYRLGFFGNAASYQKIATYFHIAVGCGQMYTSRAINGILHLRSQVIIWPDTQGRLQISNRISELPNCIGFVNGALFPFKTKPSFHGEDYYTRKGNYAVHGLIVCNDQKQIMYLHAGYPGSSHDQRALTNFTFFKIIATRFSSKQYICSDS
ncbi:hypothetical protein THRCLA_22830, partial [Thraustotheca clavata]